MLDSKISAIILLTLYRKLVLRSTMLQGFTKVKFTQVTQAKNDNIYLIMR